MIPRAALLALAVALAAGGAEDGGSRIAAALLPLPLPLRDSAAVVELDSAFKPHLLRRGSNGMVCIADRPGDADFDVRCYRDVFIDVVYRGFQLHHQGVAAKDARGTIESELKAGTLRMTREPTAGYRCLGPITAFDSVNVSVREPIKCWQSVHFPFRTARELGLPQETEIPDSVKHDTPFVMASGSYWSHVMIEHP